MWIKRKKIEDLESKLNFLNEIVYDFLQDKYVNKLVEIDSLKFRVNGIAIRDSEIFVYGGTKKEPVEILGFEFDTYPFWFNIKDVNLCAE
jgi:hypothetical protein